MQLRTEMYDKSMSVITHKRTSKHNLIPIITKSVHNSSKRAVTDCSPNAVSEICRMGFEIG